MLPTVRRWSDNPYELLRDFDRMLSRPTNGWEQTTASYPCDIRETTDGLVVEAELPGFTKDEIDVSVEQGILSINAERKSEQKDGEQHLHERHYTRVQRRFALPTSVDPNEVDAHLESGVLTLTLQKKEEVRPRKIEIK